MTNKRETSWSIIGGVKRRGDWRPAPELLHVSPVGGANLDLTETVIPAGGFTLTKISIAGGVNLVVPADARVEVTNRTLLGRTSVEPGGKPDGPLVEITAIGLVGGVTVKRL